LSAAKSGAEFDMVRYRRNFIAGGTFFFTLTLADRTSRALVDHVEALRAAMRRIRRSRPFEVDAVVVLPDHLHIVMTLPSADADYTNRWRLIKRGFTDALMKSGILVARHRNGEAALWQRRFWEHTIRDDEDFERHIDYVHFNPVKHGLVSRVCDWPYSSFHRYVRQGMLTADWAGDASDLGANFGERAGDRSPD
jgi:putative transposase